MIVTVNLAVTLKMDSDDSDFYNSRHQKFLEVFIYIYGPNSVGREKSA